MAAISPGKLVLGGVAAGVVMNAIDYVSNNFILAKDWQNVAQLRNIDLARMGGPSAIVTYAIVDLLFGFLLVLTYAGIRPRFGPGPGTATVASGLVFAAWALVLSTFAGVFFSWDVYIRTGALALVAMLAAGQAGAWVYSEEAPAED
jgi:hypothetical protein